MEHNKEAAVNRIIAFFDQISNKVDICKNFNNYTGKYHLLYELFFIRINGSVKLMKQKEIKNKNKQKKYKINTGKFRLHYKNNTGKYDLLWI